MRASARAPEARGALRDGTRGFPATQTVIMNITDHLTRVRQQDDASAERVFGALYGRQRGMEVEVATSFEMLYAARDGGGPP